MVFPYPMDPIMVFPYPVDPMMVIPSHLIYPPVLGLTSFTPLIIISGQDVARGHGARGDMVKMVRGGEGLINSTIVIIET